ncbi:putative DEAD/DEAH-box RNA helicase [Tetraselmis virus 1]|uniref:Putative DEAD/DEAH-box RNA helicase n=1 Tax=Tetraselmis virus 1 TaxID=2060617 RepID=A0A2P0VNB7_9VIRU|nr:putative DEAD/DEAH-box RNA helicase [Tetraselmis virus 1]AUF82405.1 putative DEAD/DEAH-box RNA helicase [Tetraselmis virus 1]
MDTATDIQRLAYNPIKDGRDVFGRSKTGTGKSLAFLIPALERFAEYRDSVKSGDVSIVILSPIKELSMQLASVAKKLTSDGFKGAGGRPFKVHTLIGKNGYHEFAKGVPCDMLVATPGSTHPKKGGGLGKLVVTDKKAADRLANVRTMILDEGDSLTDQGFVPTLRVIDSKVKRSSSGKSGNNRYQMLVFSATLPPDLASSPMMKSRMNGIVYADTVGHGHKSVGSNVVQEIIVGNSRYQLQILASALERHIREMEQSGGSKEDADFQEKLQKQLSSIPSLFSELVDNENLLKGLASLKPPKTPTSAEPAFSWKILVFVSSSMYVDYINEALRNVMRRYRVFKIHGKLPPSVRSNASDNFRRCDKCILVSTDASARGMDYAGITGVFQIGFTNRSEYIQRAGRVGRAGARGYAATILDHVEADRVLRTRCIETDETCIGDVVNSGNVKVLRARAASESSEVKSTDKSFLYDKDLSARVNPRYINVNKLFSSWLGGIASNFKRLKIPPKEAVNWADRFAQGIGARATPKYIRSKLKV